ncbi:hypothetical protein NIES2101_14300 [Calothrix sp. HK-06]|nr:hypothetical protein NIES2101_14300 [Calothrix sp. HK-06]
MKNKLMSTTIRYALGTVIGFATIVSMMGVSLAQALTIDSPNGKEISNIVLYVKTSSGTIIKVKIDNFSAGPSTLSYNPTSILQQYPSSQLVAYTIKAGNNKSDIGPGEGELKILDSSLTQNELPTGTSQITLEYTEVLKLAQTQTQAQTPIQTETPTQTANIQPPTDTRDAVTVPEPATATALGIFGLGFIFKSRKKA